MGKLISLIKPPKKYLLFVFLFIIFSIICYSIPIIFNNILIEKSSDNNKRENYLIYYFFKFLGNSLFIIPELFIKKNISELNKTSDIKVINKGKYILIICVVDLFILLYIFGSIYFDSYLFERDQSDIIIENYGLDYFFIFIISIIYFKNSYYKHQYISFIIIIVLAIIRFFIRLDHYQFFSFNTKDIIIESFLIILNSFFNSFYFVFFKVLIEKYYFSSFKLLYLFGFINVVIFLILIITFTFIPCERNILCSIEYNNKYYFENIYSFLKNHTTLEIFRNFVIYLTKGYPQIFIIAIIQKFTLCHVFLPVEIITFFFLEFKIYSNTFFLSCIFISFIFETFFTLVFLEIIELKFCGLNNYIKKNIEKRALDDANNASNLNDSNDYSLKGKNNIFEISDGYLIDYDDQYINLEEELLEEAEKNKKDKKLELKKYM